jgi:hypothetical protein
MDNPATNVFIESVPASAFVQSVEVLAFSVNLRCYVISEWRVIEERRECKARRLNQRDLKRYSVCCGTGREPSFAAVFETPSHAL